MPAMKSSTAGKKMKGVGKAAANGAGPASKVTSKVEDMDRKALQTLAKSLGLKANVKTVELIAAIQEHYQHGAFTAPPASIALSPPSADALPTTAESKTSGRARNSQEKSVKVKQSGGEGKGGMVLEALSRPELQALAKKMGVKANLKTAQLIAQIRAKDISDSLTPSSVAPDAKSSAQDEAGDISPPREGRRSSTGAPPPSLPPSLPSSLSSPLDRFAEVVAARKAARERQRQTFNAQRTSRVVALISKTPFQPKAQPTNQTQNRSPARPEAQRKRLMTNKRPFKTAVAAKDGTKNEKKIMPRREKENLQAKRQEARLATAILSLQQQGSRARKVRSPVKQGVKRAGENRRSKFVKSVSLKRQALYGKNRVQEARESGERKVEGTDE